MASSYFSSSSQLGVCYSFMLCNLPTKKVSWFCFEHIIITLICDQANHPCGKFISRWRVLFLWRLLIVLVIFWSGLCPCNECQNSGLTLAFKSAPWTLLCQTMSIIVLLDWYNQIWCSSLTFVGWKHRSKPYTHTSLIQPGRLRKMQKFIYH